MRRNFKVVMENISSNLIELQKKLNSIKECSNKNEESNIIKDYYNNNKKIIEEILTFKTSKLDSDESLKDFQDFRKWLNSLDENISDLNENSTNIPNEAGKKETILLLTHFKLKNFVQDIKRPLEYLETEEFYREKIGELCEYIHLHNNKDAKNLLRECYQEESTHIKPQLVKGPKPPGPMPGIVDLHYVNSRESDYYGKTPLHVAVETNNYEMIPLLIGYGASLMPREYKNDDNIIHIIAKKAETEPEEANKLFKTFLDIPEEPCKAYPKVEFERLINVYNNEEETPLQILIRHPNYNNNDNTFIELTKSFYELGANVIILSEDERATLPEDILNRAREDFDIFSLNKIEYDNPYIDYAWKTGETEYMFKGLGLSSEGAQGSQVDDLTQNNKLGEIADMSDGD